MTDPSPSGPSGIPFQDILVALFKHKWKVAICTALGLLAGGAVFFCYVPVYESQAKLLVKYVVDHALIDTDESAAQSRDQSVDNIINAEVEILTSWDLAEEVARVEGLVERGVAPTTTAAALRIQSGLTITPRKGSVIVASYKDRDATLATTILNRLLQVYLAKHLKVHRPADPAQAGVQSEKVSTNLKATERNLDEAKSKAGIISVEEGAASLTIELEKTQEQLQTAQAEFEEQRARVVALGGELPATSPKSPNPGAANPKPPDSDPPAASATSTASNADLDQYQMLMGQVARLRQKELDLLAKFKPETSEVRTTQRQIRDLERQRKTLVAKFPDLITRVPAGTPGAAGRAFDLGFEQARLVGLQARVERLTSQLGDVRERFNKFASSASPIDRLEREKKVNEDLFKYVTGRVERARIDADLNPTNMPNISKVQEPSPALRVTSARNKVAAGLAGGGVALGIGFALLLELLLNRTVKRPLELESRLHIPLTLAIPRISRSGHARLLRDQAGKNGRRTTSSLGRPSVAPWDLSHFIRPFSEVLRDRLAVFFDVHGMVHKPKLVGVAGFSAGAGASTLAGGLAAALSETGDGKVLVVDMNVGQTDAHPFFKGKPAYSVTTAMQSSSRMDSAADNLYLATVNPENDAPIPMGLKKFHSMVSGLKASAYDYIIFDMPHLSQTSPTMAVAPYMDQMLLVVEAERNDRDVVKRRYSELMASKSKVSVIFNKARHYGPKWLQGEL